MCGIFASADKDMLLKLAALNQYRGSHSFSAYNLGTRELVREFGEFDASKLTFGEYFICHVQAPTTAERGLDAVHPAQSAGGALLWHNGIIKDFEVKRLQQAHNTDIAWDTRLVLFELMANNWTKRLSTINGSFACVLVEGSNMYVFRNEISPLFYDDDMNFSSVKFEGSRMLDPNIMYKVSTALKRMSAVVKFTTFENPYFFNLEDTQ